MRCFVGFSWALLALIATAPCGAQPPDSLKHFTVVSSRSTFVETGPAATDYREYPLSGQYDFLEIWTAGTPDSSLQVQARFDEVDLRAPLGAMLPAFIDVGNLLNLEGLRGELLPLGAPFDVYRFEGLINDSAAASPLEQSFIELYAALQGPWMYLYGETERRSWSPDRPEYQIQAVARLGDWADRNSDGVVDAADYTHARNEGDTAIATWRDQYGEIAPDAAEMSAAFASAMATSQAVAVPEPSALMLAALWLSSTLLSSTRATRRVRGT